MGSCQDCPVATVGEAEAVSIQLVSPASGEFVIVLDAPLSAAAVSIQLVSPASGEGHRIPD